MGPAPVRLHRQSVHFTGTDDRNVATAINTCSHRWALSRAPCGKKVYYGQVLDYKRGRARFKEHVENPKSDIKNTWSWEMLSKHVVVDRPALTFHEKKLIQRHDDNSGVVCINKIYRTVIKEKVRDEKRKRTNLLRDQLKINEAKSSIVIKKNGVKKRWSFSSSGRRGSATREEALNAAMQFVQNQYMAFYQ